MHKRLSLCLCLLPFAAQADMIETSAPVREATLFAYGAALTRQADFTAPAGSHEIIIPGLPSGTDAGTIRISPPDGVTIGAISLADGRLPATSSAKRPEVDAAEAEVKRLEDVLRGKEGAVAAIRARAEAAAAQIDVLRGVGQMQAASAAADGTLDQIRALNALIGEEVLAARQAALAAEAEATTADRALEGDRAALEAARQALAALTTEGEDSSTLSIALTTAADGPVVLRIETITGDAHWSPLYDARLTRQGGPALTLDRGVVIGQDTGEDWRDVKLTLSTAHFGERTEAGWLWPNLRRIETKEEHYSSLAEAGMAEPVTEPEVVEERSVAVFVGMTVTYQYPTPVTVRTGVDALRLPLDRLSFTPGIRADAVPLRDETAYLAATFTNDGKEVILPGPVTLYHDGALVGETELGLIAAGDEATLGFGPIDGLRLTRTVPDRMEGQGGIITTTNEQTETAILKVENLTTEDWPVRVTDQVPYSEQEDLVISHSAEPAPTSEDADGQRGLLIWDFTLKAGGKQEIRLEQSLKWPDGMVLQ